MGVGLFALVLDFFVLLSNTKPSSEILGSSSECFLNLWVIADPTE